MDDFNHKHFNYRWTKGFGIAILLALVLLFGAAYAQNSPNTPSGYSIDSVTGNLILNGSVTSATGWSSTTGSPSWTPNSSPLGSFDPADGYTFSYIPESLGQNPGINLGSFNHGYLNSGAVFVTGFSYGLTYRFPCANSIGTNCDGTSQTAAPANPTQDNLRVEVGYYPSTGSPTFYTHQLGLKNINDGDPAYNPNWQTLVETVTFAGAKPLAQAGSVNYEIIGSDAGGWACLNGQCYGPQVKNAYIRANYSVDPCILNPAYNPNCPGFNNVIQGVQSPTYWHSYNIAQRLPHIGGGVQLHGFEYGFNWSNYGACYNTFLFWCTDWRTDGGATINFNVTDKNNNVLYSDSQYRSGNNQSGSYYNRFLFTETRNSLDMGNVNWWLSGVWNHLAVAGWTRPIWTPDPCYFNGLYSPNCTNFQETLTQVIADINAQQERIAALNSVSTSSTTSTPNSSITTAINDATTTSPTVSVTTENLVTASTQSTKSSSMQPQAMDSTGAALDLVRSLQQRENQIAMRASQSARQSAESSAQTSLRQAESIANELTKTSNQFSDVQDQKTIAQQDQNQNHQALLIIPAPVNTNAVRIKSNDQVISENTESNAKEDSSLVVVAPVSIGAVNQNHVTSINISPNNQNTLNTTTQTTTQELPNSSPVVVLAPQNILQPTTAAVSSASLYQAPVIQVDTRDETNFNQQQVNVPSATQGAINVIQVPAQVLEQTNVIMPAPQAVTGVDIPENKTAFATDRTNPLNDILETKPQLVDSDQPKQTTSTVKSNVQDNDAAAGVSIANIARTPVGFGSYMVALTDANFYAPKEIYRNQKTVDNVRALRQLASDSLHQQMVDQQYLPR